MIALLLVLYSNVSIVAVQVSLVSIILLESGDQIKSLEGIS